MCYYFYYTGHGINFVNLINSHHHHHRKQYLYIYKGSCHNSYYYYSSSSSLARTQSSSNCFIVAVLIILLRVGIVPDHRTSAMLRIRLITPLIILLLFRIFRRNNRRLFP